MLNFDHPLFKDFKNYRINAEITICFPAGLGGNFLNTLLEDNVPLNWNASNDFANGVWLNLDHDTDIRKDNESFKPVFDYTALYNVAKMMPFVQDRRCLLAHEPPFITSNVCDYKTKEILFIESDHRYYWIGSCLYVFKNMLSSDYQNKPHIIRNILNHMPYNGRVHFEEYVSTINSLRGLSTHISLDNTPLSWVYFLRSKATDFDPSNVDNFKNFIWNYIFEYDAYTRENCEYFTNSKTHFVDKVSVYNRVNYVDLFFKKKIPANSMLSTLDKESLSIYALKNLNILRQIADLCPNDKRTYLTRLIDDL